MKYETGLRKIQERFPQVAPSSWTQMANSSVIGRADLPKSTKTSLEEHHEAQGHRRRAKDREHIESRLAKIQARYPQMDEFYELELRDTPTGPPCPGSAKKVSALIREN